jgi:hypothetical protein
LLPTIYKLKLLFAFACRFIHTGTLTEIHLRKWKVCLKFVLMANEFIVVPELLRLTQRVLQLQVQPLNVWLVLTQLKQQPHLAAICNEVKTFPKIQSL